MVAEAMQRTLQFSRNLQGFGKSPRDIEQAAEVLELVMEVGNGSPLTSPPSRFKKEWGELGGYVNMVVVLKFGIMEEFIPVILALVAEDMEILLQLLVYMFCLAVGLCVVGSSGVELHSKQSVELPGELCHKLWSPVQDVGVGEAIKLPDIPPIQLCGAHGRAGGVSWNEVHSLAIQVYYHHDHIVTMGIGELYNEVYRCYAPLFYKHW
ncbi:hypothetical protein E4T56_gene1367 [Termitomyces sp. T112]|nr:hypothetical protein E4T56_gene1367 [Termitomyces sp. T112]